MTTTSAPSPMQTPTRVAWFSPMPPSTSGIAAYSIEVLPLLRELGFEVEVFVDGTANVADGLRAARDFVWIQRRRPFDLTVFQLGNAACHDYMWGYLFRYPGLVVLHDAQLHQARAQALLQRYEPRLADYLEEFAWNHPDAPPAIGRLVAAGLGGTLYGHWPHVRLVLHAARIAAVHSTALATRLAETHGVDVRAISMGVRDPVGSGGELTASQARVRHGIPEDALVVGAFGGLTPEKRLPQLLEAVGAIANEHRSLHVMLVGAPAAHYDVRADADAAGISARVHLTGFVPDTDLPAYLQAADVCACLRWPTNGETSASWLRAMAAGRPTVITDLAHQADLPVLDPRNWQPSRAAAPVAVGVPVLDEAASLRAALDGLARNARLRKQLGEAGRAYWREHHTVAAMASAYAGVLREATTRAVPRPSLPRHLTAKGDERIPGLLAPYGVKNPLALDHYPDRT